MLYLHMRHEDTCHILTEGIFSIRFRQVPGSNRRARRFFVILLSPFRRIPEWYLKSGRENFLLNLCHSLFSNHPTIERYVTWSIQRFVCSSSLSISEMTVCLLGYFFVVYIRNDSFFQWDISFCTSEMIVFPPGYFLVVYIRNDNFPTGLFLPCIHQKL
jgi:hypothetical protein